MKEKEIRSEKSNIENVLNQLMEIEIKYANILTHPVCVHFRNTIVYANFDDHFKYFNFYKTYVFF